MNSIDLSPLYRNSIGFDRMANVLNSALRGEADFSSYPPYDIEVVDENKYDLTLAVAGFNQEELDIQIEQGVLTIKGEKASSDDKGKKRQFLHHGIATRVFERTFNLAEYVEVTEASLNNGLLTISLKKEVPEAMKPRKISISSSSDGKVIEHKRDKEESKAA